MSRPNDVRHLVGILLGMFASSGPALVNWYGHAVLPIVTAFVIASVGGALAGRILVPPGERMRAHLDGARGASQRDREIVRPGGASRHGSRIPALSLPPGYQLTAGVSATPRARAPAEVNAAGDEVNRLE